MPGAQIIQWESRLHLGRNLRNTMQKRLERFDRPVEAAGAANCGTHRSITHLRFEGNPSSNRTLVIRIGGWIASFFSWYRY
jgi:hypothetical protein